jgi:hypothetical protein
MGVGFTPIRLKDYVRLFLRGNPGEKEAAVTARLQSALQAYKEGARCHCGSPIWVIGSAEAGNTCFTCCTGESDPSDDYELFEACDKNASSAAGGKRFTQNPPAVRSCGNRGRRPSV